MTVTLDHTVLGAADSERAARAFADLMGLAFEGFDGVDGRFAVVRVNEGLRLFFATAEPVAPQHVAFRVDGQAFERVLTGLRRAGLAYGSSPRDPANGRTEHPLAARGVFWVDPDGHLFEVMSDTPD
jgi:catechol 2,3-dioxygenase-like lactoylglutathione lyase family enzyme